MNARQLDQFYTKRSIALDCINYIKNIVNISEDYFFIEPSAGTGSFFNLLMTKNKLGLDIMPKSPGIIELDFMNFKKEDYNLLIKDRKIITLGNPPFGRNSSLALKFLNKAAEFSDYVAFILPKTFKKESMVFKINKNLHLVKEYELPNNSFIYQDESYNVPCVFQIWQKKSEIRKVVKSTIIHPDFIFTTKDNADFAIRRVGGLAGKVIEDFESYSPASHYYIKTIAQANKVKQKFKEINWDSVKNNTAGNPSISKRELIKLYEEY